MKDKTSINRRHFLQESVFAWTVATAGLVMVSGVTRVARANTGAQQFEIVRTPQEWKQLLTKEQFAVLRRRGDREAIFQSASERKARRQLSLCRM